MKKSILFSSIATTCCLLLQNSANAEWVNFSGELALSSSAGNQSANATSSISNNWTTSIEVSEGESSSSCSTSWAPNSFGAGAYGVGSVFDSLPGGSGGINGSLSFSVSRESMISLNVSANGAYHVVGGAHASLESIINGIHTNLVGLNVYYDMPQHYGEEISDSRSIIILPNIEYRLSLVVYGVGDNGGAGCGFNMSLTPIPAPAASALLALAGLVSRRRRA